MSNVRTSTSFNTDDVFVVVDHLSEASGEVRSDNP